MKLPILPLWMAVIAAKLPRMELIEAMRSAPTTRRFLADPVPREALLRALDSARHAPSGGNRQPWRVVAVRDAARRAALHDLYQPHWRLYLEAMGAAELDERQLQGDPRLRVLREADHFARHLREVPLHLVVCAELSELAIVDAELDRPSIVGGASIYPFVQNLLLALRCEGLGAALTTLLAPAEPQVRKLLDLPPTWALAAYVLVGRRAEPWPERLRRNPVESFAFAERFGEPL